MNEARNMAEIAGCFRVRWEARQRGDRNADLTDASVCGDCRYNVMAAGEPDPGCYQNLSELSLGIIYEFLESVDPEGMRDYLPIMERHEAQCRREWAPMPEEDRARVLDLARTWKRRIEGMTEDDLMDAPLPHPNAVDNVELFLNVLIQFGEGSERLKEPAVFLWPLRETAVSE